MRFFFLSLVMLLSLSVSAEVNLSDRQGQKLDINALHFTDESGTDVTLAKYFQPNTPVLLTLVYYGCPALCTVVLNQLTTGLKQTGLTPGRAFELIAISIDPTETPTLALRKKTSYLKAMNLPPETPGFHFLVGKKSAIDEIADSLGFEFTYDPKTKIYDHPAAVFALSPTGVVTRTITGVEFKARSLHRALAEAAGGSSQSAFLRMIYYCQQASDTSIFWYRALSGVLLILGLIFFFWILRRKNELPKIDSPEAHD